MQSPKKINRASGKNLWVAAMLLGAAALGWLGAAPAQNVPDGTLAAAIRASGYACKHVIEKERAGEDASVWRVRCDSGSFRVTMTDGANPEVVQID